MMLLSVDVSTSIAEGCDSLDERLADLDQCVIHPLAGLLLLLAQVNVLRSGVQLEADQGGILGRHGEDHALLIDPLLDGDGYTLGLDVHVLSFLFGVCSYCTRPRRGCQRFWRRIFKIFWPPGSRSSRRMT